MMTVDKKTNSIEIFTASIKYWDGTLTKRTSDYIEACQFIRDKQNDYINNCVNGDIDDLETEINCEWMPIDIWNKEREQASENL